MLYFPDFDSLLIWIFVLIDDMNRQTELPLYTERLSNNNIPRFYDSELLTCAIFTELIGYRIKKAGHKFISGFLIYLVMKSITENFSNFVMR
jgi:hypothetical protein